MKEESSNMNEIQRIHNRILDDLGLSNLNQLSNNRFTTEEFVIKTMESMEWSNKVGYFKLLKVSIESLAVERYLAQQAEEHRKSISKEDKEFEECLEDAEVDYLDRCDTATFGRHLKTGETGSEYIVGVLNSLPEKFRVRYMDESIEMLMCEN